MCVWCSFRFIRVQNFIASEAMVTDNYASALYFDC